MTDRQPFNVLFLCTGNSARSILAEAVLDRLGKGAFRAYSAGSMPTGVVNPHALALLKREMFNPDTFRSKSWDEFDGSLNPEAPRFDFVFTVCGNAAGEVCPIWPGQPLTAHWGIDDPAAVEGSDAEKALAFAEAYRKLRARISAFVALPLASLDRISLKQRLDAIGNIEEPAGA